MIGDNVLPVFPANKLAFSHGEGCYLYTNNGDEYLDFGSGIATSSLGHNHPHLVAAISRQAQKLIHCSNWYQIEEQQQVAQRLCEATGFRSVFFTNSGTEAAECAIKLARHYHHNSSKYQIISFDNCFHGRSLAAWATTGRGGFEPLMPGFIQSKYNDIDALKRCINKHTAAIAIEPIQGEAGCITARLAYLKQLRQLCYEHDILLIFDEVQTGVGRTGKLYAYQWLDSREYMPDILLSAKGLGGGFPLGACLVNEAIHQSITPSLHGSTFGGNPLAMMAINAVLDVIMRDGFLTKLDALARKLWHGLVDIVAHNPQLFKEVRGAGLMLAVVLQEQYNNTDLWRILQNEYKLLTIPAANNSLRLLPPLIVSEEQIDRAINIINNAVAKLG